MHSCKRIAVGGVDEVVCIAKAWSVDEHRWVVWSFLGGREHLVGWLHPELDLEFVQNLVSGTLDLASAYKKRGLVHRPMHR